MKQRIRDGEETLGSPNSEPAIRVLLESWLHNFRSRKAPRRERL